MNKKTSLITILFTTIFLLSGCASADKNKDKTPREISFDSDVRPKYLTNGKDKAIYQGETFTLAMQIVKGDTVPQSPLTKRLAKENYIFVELAITSKESKILFKPSFIRITTDQIDHLQPMDYTDLYDFEQFRFKFAPGENGLNSLRGKYYDYELYIYPRKSKKALLIFEPVNADAKKGLLTIKEFYVDNDAIELTFPLKAEKIKVYNE